MIHRTMKIHTTLAIAVIALTLGTSLQAAPDSRKKNRDKRDAATQQIEKSFDAIDKAVADARKQATKAIKQRNAALKAIQDEKVASEKSRKEAGTKAAATNKAKADAEKKSRTQLQTNLNETKQNLRNASRQIADLGNKVKAKEYYIKAQKIENADLDLINEKIKELTAENTSTQNGAE